MEINHQQLDEILADFSARSHLTYLDNPMLNIGYAALAEDDLGLPKFSAELPKFPVALVERHQALWTHPDTPGPEEEVWTASALSLGMERIVYGTLKLPNLDEWAIGEWPRDDGGIQLQQPDGNLFVYSPCAVDPAWITAAKHYHWVLVLHGPRLGLRLPPDEPTAELIDARKAGLVTGGLMRWAQVRKS